MKSKTFKTQFANYITNNLLTYFGQIWCSLYSFDPAQTISLSDPLNPWGSIIDIKKCIQTDFLKFYINDCLFPVAGKTDGGYLLAVPVAGAHLAPA